MFPNGILVVILMHLCLEIAANKYCLYCDVPGTHTMCRFPDRPAQTCLNYRMEQLTEEEKLELVKFHNEYRNRVACGREHRGAPGPQPPAANMRQLSWDNELSMIAKRWADQCISFNDNSTYDMCRDTERFLVGQNVATDFTSPPEYCNLQDQVKRWYNEVKKYNKAWVHSIVYSVDPKGQIGHYTQLVWSQTYLVGCERVRFEEYNDDEDDDYTESKTIPFMVDRIVCNYGPAGNLVNDPVYKVGSPCSLCPNGTFCNPNYDGLCATKAQLAADKRRIEEDMKSMERSNFEQKEMGIKGNARNQQDGTAPAPRLDPNARSDQTRIPPSHEDEYTTTFSLQNYNKGVWINGGCYCPIQGRSVAPKQISVHITLYITVFVLLIVT